MLLSNRTTTTLLLALKHHAPLPLAPLAFACAGVRLLLPAWRFPGSATYGRQGQGRAAGRHRFPARAGATVLLAATPRLQKARKPPGLRRTPSLLRSGIRSKTHLAFQDGMVYKNCLLLLFFSGIPGRLRLSPRRLGPCRRQPPRRHAGPKSPGRTKESRT